MKIQRTVRLDPEDDGDLVDLATVNNTTPAEYARRLIIEGIKRKLNPDLIREAHRLSLNEHLAAVERARQRRESPPT